MRFSPLIAIGLSLLTSRVRANDFPAEKVEFFEQHIRPLLAENCFKCHSESQQKGGLRLDSREFALKGGDTGPALVPGDIEASELIKAVRYDPDGYQMPPSGKLPAEKLAHLEKWVADGAAWPVGANVVKGSATWDEKFTERSQHWSYQPLRHPKVPSVQNTNWPRTPIDRFILAALEAKGLGPAPEAPRGVRLRRAAFDLIGLPPAIEQIDQIQDEAALSRQLDQWLASPHFGERWGRHWLDLVRYAETRGHEFDYDVPNAWHYRDYVIRAINDDVPYNQFTVEHLAGDILTPGTRPFASRINPMTEADESIVGTGFWYFGEWVHSPVDLEGDEAERVQNQVEVCTKAFLGMTVGCARCHDHKFDPISQKDYYALCGYLDSAAYVQSPYQSREHNRRIAEQLAKIDDEAKSIVKQWLAESERTLPEMPHYQPVKDETLIVDYSESTSAVVSDGFAFGSRTRQPGDVIWGSQPDHPLNGIHSRGEVARDRAWIACRPAGDVMEDVGVENWKRAGRTLTTPVFLVGPGKIYTWVRGGCRTYVAMNSHLTIRGPLHGQLLKDHPHSPDWRWIELDMSRYRGSRGMLEFVLREDEDFEVAAVVQASESPAPWNSASFQPIQEVNAKLAATGEVDDPAIAAIESRLLPLFERRQRLIQQIQTTSEVTPAMLEDGAGYDTPLAVRGNPHKPADAVPRRFLEVFGGVAGESNGGSPRLALAERIVDPERTPITARVIVNRIWQHYFGVGLVASADDFGRMGSEPSHPELLDWLASELISHEWSLKPIHRLILDSAAYRQASYLPESADETTRARWAAGEEADPTDALLHRMRLRRIEAEAIRDSVLVAAERLDDRLYGRGVQTHLTEHHEGRGKPTVSGPLDGAGRRSLYLQVRRNFPEPLLVAFDFPVPSTTRGRRSTSNVPAQALALMNNPFVLEEATRFAKRVIADRPDDDSRVALAFEIAYARKPTSMETTEALEFLKSEQAVGSSEEAAWADLCHALMNAKEFAFVP
jgi:hypothetical protein